MSPHKCQICGRRKGLRKDGTIVLHYVRSVPCPGAGFVPIEQDDGRLVGYAAELRATLSAVRITLRDLHDRRVNWIDPVIVARERMLSQQLDRTNRRIQRHHSWPMRAECEWEKYGWRTPAPAYLLERQSAA